MKLTQAEHAAVERWRPSPANPVCECRGASVCAACALVPIIDRLAVCGDVVGLMEEELFGWDEVKQATTRG